MVYKFSDRAMNIYEKEKKPQTIKFHAIIAL